jgi:apolipoprotein N-acyltransferase
LSNVHSSIGNRQSSLRFSVLICFEDIFPDLARRFVRAGARWLFVITNDGWFGPTAAAYQHAQASTFRAVELRVPIARAANTGWSGCIDAAGRWIGSVQDAAGRELFVAGTHTCELPLSSADSGYRRWGDWFAWLCCIATLVAICRRKCIPGAHEHMKR